MATSLTASKRVKVAPETLHPTLSGSSASSPSSSKKLALTNTSTGFISSATPPRPAASSSVPHHHLKQSPSKPTTHDDTQGDDTDHSSSSSTTTDLKRKRAATRKLTKLNTTTASASTPSTLAIPSSVVETRSVLNSPLQPSKSSIIPPPLPSIPPPSQQQSTITSSVSITQKIVQAAYGSSKQLVGIFSRRTAASSSSTESQSSSNVSVREEQFAESVQAVAESIAEISEEEDISQYGNEDAENELPETTTTTTDHEEVYYTGEFDPFHFIRSLPPLTEEQLSKPTALPKKTRSSHPVTLVLDLDETLVHCSTTPLDDPDVVFPVEFSGQTYTVMGKLRPHFESFLERASAMFEVVVFTASQKIYADRLLNIMDPQRKYIKYRLFRDSCTQICGNYMKDLNILGRDLSKTVIVDNSPQAFAYQISNGIPITSWYEDRNDTELLQLLEFLESIQNVEDVRPHVERQYRMRDRIFGTFESHPTSSSSH